MTKGGDGTLSVCLAPVEEGGSSQEITAVNTLLWAIGRDANVTNLGLEAAVSVTSLFAISLLPFELTCTVVTDEWAGW